MRILVIANPAAGRGRALRRLRHGLAAGGLGGLSVDLAVTRAAGEVGAIALAAVDAPPDVLAVCGGDGTVNEVACAVPDPPFPVALLPGGTQNLLARELGIPLDPLEALRGVPRLEMRRIDLGLIEGQCRRSFLLMAGVGFDAWVAASVGEAAKARLGTGAYYIAALRALWSFQFRTLTVESEEGCTACTSCVLSNAAAYGGGLRLNPSADMHDGILDGLMVALHTRAGYLRLLLAARLGVPLETRSVRRRRSERFAVLGPPGVLVQADGEVCGRLPIQVSVRRDSFPLLASPRRA